MKALSPAGPKLSQGSRRRRDRLRELERGVEAGAWEDRRRAVRTLLARPLTTHRHENRILVNRHREWLTLWFAHHAGWELHIDADAARLVKRPPDILDASRPCRDPAGKDVALSRRGYAFLCLVLGILTQEGRQLTLKNIADRIEGIRVAEPVFEEGGIPLGLNRRESRRDLVQALRVLLDWGVLKRVDGDQDRFVGSDQADALYNVNQPILSRLLAARQPPSLVLEEDFEQRLLALWQGNLIAEDSDDWRIRQIRQGLFRRLLDDPVLYVADLAEDERAYLDKRRSFLIQEIEQATGLLPEIRREGIAMVDRDGELSDYHLPETGTDGHLTLLVATRLAQRLHAQRLHGKQDAPVVPLTVLQAEIREMAEANPGWRRDAREPGSEVGLASDAVRRLEALHLLRTVHEPVAGVVPLPAIGRFGLREPATAKTPVEELLL